MYCEYFLPHCGLTFNILDDLGKTEGFRFDGSQIYQFLLFLLVFFCVLRNICLPQDREDFLLFSLRSLIVLALTFNSVKYFDLILGQSMRIEVHFASSYSTNLCTSLVFSSLKTTI